MNRLNEKIYATKRILTKDKRGWFLKVINGQETGNPFSCEVYLTSAKAGESRGGHYHLKAQEWFTLIKGEALLTIIDINTDEKLEISLSGDKPETIYMPPEIAHNFYNVGDSDFILIAFTDVKYDPLDTLIYNFNIYQQKSFKKKY